MNINVTLIQLHYTINMSVVMK